MQEPYSVIVTITGLTETEIESRIMDLIKAQENPTFALLARPGYIALRMTAHGSTIQNAHDLITPFLLIKLCHRYMIQRRSLSFYTESIILPNHS